MTITDYLDALKAHFGISTDYQLWKITGWNKASISNYRTGKNGFSDEHAAQVAEWLGVHKGQVLGDTHAERAKNPDTAAMWRQIADHFRSMAAVLVMVIAVTLFALFPGRSEASTVTLSAFDNPSTVYYVKLLRRLAARVRHFLSSCCSSSFLRARVYACA